MFEYSSCDILQLNSAVGFVRTYESRPSPKTVVIVPCEVCYFERYILLNRWNAD
jgi:hypothetical protein